MNIKRSAAIVLRVVGALLMLLGCVHLAATPHIPGLISGSPHSVYEFAVGPTLLNHVLVGVLLLPLGFTTWLAAGGGERGERWATPVLIANALVTLALPTSLVAFMRQAEYYTAPLFVFGVGIVAVISLLMLAATYTLLRRPAKQGLGS